MICCQFFGCKSDLPPPFLLLSSENYFWCFLLFFFSFAAKSLICCGFQHIWRQITETPSGTTSNKKDSNIPIFSAVDLNTGSQNSHQRTPPSKAPLEKLSSLRSAWWASTGSTFPFSYSSFHAFGYYTCQHSYQMTSCSSARSTFGYCHTTHYWGGL